MPAPSTKQYILVIGRRVAPAVQHKKQHKRQQQRKRGAQQPERPFPLFQPRIKDARQQQGDAQQRGQRSPDGRRMKKERTAAYSRTKPADGRKRGAAAESRFIRTASPRCG